MCILLTAINLLPDSLHHITLNLHCNLQVSVAKIRQFIQHDTGKCTI